MTTRKGVSVDSWEAGGCRTALSMSSGSYCGLAIQEPIQRKRTALINAPKISSSGKAEQHVIPHVMKHMRGLPEISAVVRNVLSSARCSGGGVAEWLVNLSWRPSGLRDFARGW